MCMHLHRKKKKEKSFFEGLKLLAEKWENISFMGDFNTVFSRFDMADGMVFKTDVGRNFLIEMIEGENLIDVWRETNQRKREFSIRQLVGNCMCQTRIDFI